MKRLGVLIILFLSFNCFGADVPSYSLSIGGDFFNYEDNYLDLGGDYIVPLQEKLEFDIGFHVGVATEEIEGDTVPSFYFPLNLGLNFLFVKQSADLLVGLGIAPILKVTDYDNYRFYAGPFIKFGSRFKIHELLNFFIEVQQDLLIGEPYWINTSTRISAGFNFLMNKNK